LQVLDDLGGDDVWGGEVGGVFQASVAWPSVAIEDGFVEPIVGEIEPAVALLDYISGRRSNGLSERIAN
jgi:hypothetical protein